jgi:cation:H+ antiporter
MIWLEFVVCAALIVAAATVLSRYADVLAEKTGLGRVWVGGLLLAGVTSLPELASGISAVSWLDAPNLAVGSILGSCLFNLLLIALMDIAYQPGSILAKAAEGHSLAASLGILLLGLVAVAALLRPTLNGGGGFGVGVFSAAVVLLYVLGARLIARFEQRRLAEVLEREAQAFQYSQISRGRAWAVFVVTAAAVVGLGVWLAAIGDRLAAETGLSRSFVGNLFLAVSTSLPEVASSLVAVRLGAIDLAISNALGSNLFNVTLLAVFDVADGRGNVWGALSTGNALAAVAAIMMTGVTIISLIYRASPRTPFRLTWDGAALIVMYLAVMAALYGLG